MLRFWSSYRLPILLWIFCCVSFLVALTALNPVYVNVCQTYKDGACQERQPVHLVVFAIDKLVETLSHAETWTALGTLAIAAFTFTLWRSTKNLWAVTKQSADAFASAERPHLLVSQLNAMLRITDVPDINAKTIPVTYTFEIKNFGRSPAFIANFIFQFHTGELPPIPAYERLWPDKNIVVPGHFLRSTSDMRKIGDIPVEEIAKVQSDELPLYIFGALEYKGIFEGKAHKLRFCYRLFFNKGLLSAMFQPAGPDSYWEYA